MRYIVIILAMLVGGCTAIQPHVVIHDPAVFLCYNKEHKELCISIKTGEVNYCTEFTSYRR